MRQQNFAIMYKALSIRGSTKGAVLQHLRQYCLYARADAEQGHTCRVPRVLSRLARALQAGKPISAPNRQVTVGATAVGHIAGSQIAARRIAAGQIAAGQNAAGHTAAKDTAGQIAAAVMDTVMVHDLFSCSAWVWAARVPLLFGDFAIPLAALCAGTSLLKMIVVLIHC